MKLKIVSDGTPMGTRVEDAETGKLLEDVISVMWSIQVGGVPTMAMVSLTMYGVPIEAVGQLFHGVKPDERVGQERSE